MINNFNLGSLDSGAGGAQFSGLTDEAHIVSGVADWIATEYAILTADSFVSIGSEQTE